MAGELITEAFGYDGGRQVTVYLPAGRPEAVVFAGDGQLISQWSGDLEAAGVPPTMVVGVHRLANEMLRLVGWDKAASAAGPPSFCSDRERRWAGARKASLVPPYDLKVRGTRKVLCRRCPPLGKTKGAFYFSDLVGRAAEARPVKSRMSPLRGPKPSADSVAADGLH